MSRLAIQGGTPVRTHPFPSWPVFDRSEEESVLDVLRSGAWWTNACGEATGLDPQHSKASQFATRFAQEHGAEFGIACANGSVAIEIALKALGIGPGHEVIVPPYTFVATATAPLNIGATPIFCDIDADTYNLDPGRIEEAITPRTRAIVPVHFAGAAADMDATFAIAKRHGLSVVEDAAHGHGGSWNGKGLGSLGDAATFSFQFSKNMTAGEGGVITTNRRDVASLCESYVWGGRVVGRPWYEHHRLGWNARMTEFQGAILLEQLKRLKTQASRRMENGLFLNEQLSRIPGLHPLRVPEYATGHPFHIYVIRFDEKEFGATRADFMAALASEGIPCSGGYAFPLYRNPMFLNGDFYPRGAESHDANKTDYAAFADLCPNAELACHQAIWLEQRLLLGTREDMRDIVTAACKVAECSSQLAGCSSLHPVGLKF